MNFTVLMSVFKDDCPNELEQALYSIWDSQTLKPSQIVLVQDGELTSSLYSVITKWEVKIPKVLLRLSLPENVGLGKALNAGLAYCSNEWIFRMDSDDISLPSRFNLQVDFIETHPDVDIFSGQVLEFCCDHEISTGIKSVPLSHTEIIRFSFWRSPFNHMAVAYKKSIVQAVGGYQHHLWMEDYNLWLRILAAGCQSANLPDTLVYARAGDDMVGRRKGLRYIKSEWKLFKLKKDLKFQATILAFFVFFLRAFPRLLPTKVLSIMYSALRKH